MKKISFLLKLKFILKKPKLIIILGDSQACAKEAIFQVLKNRFKIGKEIFIFQTSEYDYLRKKSLSFLLKNSSLAVLVVTYADEALFGRYFSQTEKELVKEINKLTKIISSGYLVLNFDNEIVKEIVNNNNLKKISFGFRSGADFQATDIKLNGGTNFKINYKGNIVPVWLESLFGKEQVYSALAAVAVGTIFNLNLVEISQALTNYQSLAARRMKMVKGIKNSIILDGSAQQQFLQ